MQTTLHRQTQDPSGVFGLPMLQVSPYFSIGGGAIKNKNMFKAFVLGYSAANSAAPTLEFFLTDDVSLFSGCYSVGLTVGTGDTAATIQPAGDILINSFCADNGLAAPDSIEWLLNGMTGKTFATPSLAVNTSRRASTSRDAFVSASVDITASLTLVTGQKGTVSLKYADDSAFTTNVVTAQPSTNGNTGTLTIGLALGQTVSATVSGIVPAGKYYRLVTTNVTGTPTYGTPVLQEVLL